MILLALVAAIIFIAIYFHRSANNIGKNGALWVAIALGTFIGLNVLVSLTAALLFIFLLDYNQAESLMVSSFIGLGAGVVGIFVVNHYLNIIPD